MNKAAHYRSSDRYAQSIEEHLFGVSHLSGKYAKKIDAETLGQLTGLLHDFGKYSEVFGSYIESAVGLLQEGDSRYRDPSRWKGRVDHSTAGAQWVWRNLDDQDPVLCLAKEILAICICSHHGGLVDGLANDGEDTLMKRMVKADENTNFKESCANADEIVLIKAAEFACSTQLVKELSGLIGVVNAGVKLPMLRIFWTGLLVRYLFSCLVDADRTDTANFENPEDTELRLLGKYTEWEPLINCFERHISGLKAYPEINRKRAEVSAHCLQRSLSDQGLFYLTVPTGGGKTLASMRFALHHARKHSLDRIIYVVPYTSIIEQNAQEIRDALKGKCSLDIDEIVLEHHSNLHEKHDTKRNRLLSENWDAPIVFTTSVQLLETLFGGGTRGARRMHQLARAILIFDEVQTLPINTIHLFNNAINFLTKVCSSSVVFCTATQPLLHDVDQNKGAVPYDEQRELAPYSDLFKGFRRIEVVDERKTGGWSFSEIGMEIERQLEALGSVLFIANTKKDAKRIYFETEGLVRHRYHLSTAMCPAHRLEILRRIKVCLQRKWPVVCVSTQLVEAGVNLDFGCVFRALAGLDSIAQAAGRCNRNNRRPNGRVLIVNLKGESLGRLREIKLAQKETLRVLDEYRESPESFGGDLISPQAVERYYHYYFYQRANEMDYEVRAKDLGRKDTLLSLLSTNSLSVCEAKRTGQYNPKRILNQAFKSAGEYFKVIDAPTQGILVHYEGFGKTKGEASRLISALTITTDTKQLKTLLIKAQRFCVNVFPHDLNKMEKAGALHETQPGSGVWYLDKHYYSPDCGACTEQVGEMEFLNG
ncbi:MAG: CRISPR-associated helicase Cas3' [Verrucomicrobia bacterium]|nr:CRISPR-associated helicase Cas3' [Verrucomicrobiota bacterium]